MKRSSIVLLACWMVGCGATVPSRPPDASVAAPVLDRPATVAAVQAPSTARCTIPPEEVRTNPSEEDAALDRLVKCFNAGMALRQWAARNSFRGKEPSPNGIPRLEPWHDTAFGPCLEAWSGELRELEEARQVLDDYLPMLLRLASLSEAMRGYYGEKRYQQDGFRGAIRFNKEVLALLDRLERTNTELSRLIDELADRRDHRSIMMEFAAGGQLRFPSLRFLEDAKFMSREVSRTKPDQVILDALVNQCLHSFEQLEKAASQVGVEDAENWEEYAVRAASFAKLLKKARDDGFSEPELNEMLDAYNSLIDASNLVRWRGGHGRSETN